MSRRTVPGEAVWTFGVLPPAFEDRAVSMTRRKLLQWLGEGALAASLPSAIGLAEVQTSDRFSDKDDLTAHASFRLNHADEALLDEIERAACRFFLEQADPFTGQVLDRAAAQNPSGALSSNRMASIAATGFGLAALCIADHRGYAPHKQVRAQVLRTLSFHAEHLPHEHGFFYHFNDRSTGKPMPFSELSSIDTCLLLCGVLTARAYFQRDAEIVRYAAAIYERVDWPWMLNGGKQFSMGWNPPSAKHPGFLKATWNHYCEMMMLPLLALGSPTHPVGDSIWHSFTRPTMSYAGFTYISAADPLFVHQYSHAFYDFRGVRDEYTNYFENSRTATRAHKAFCLSLNFPYGEDYWGISASDSATGYQAWGGPPRIGRIDGSVVPYATAGSLPFLPEECLVVQRSLRARFSEHGWGRYGFCDAMHPAVNFYNGDVLGIDLGITALMIENLRSGFVWSVFKRNPEVGAAMRKAGFVKDPVSGPAASQSASQ